jgi:hypothetical protein
MALRQHEAGAESHDGRRGRATTVTAARLRVASIGQVPDHREGHLMADVKGTFDERFR